MEMPHHRFRHLSPVFNKSLSYWPVICLVGARQVGKSTFLKKLINYSYLTLDDPGTADLARRNPKAILEPPCAIDEVQKVPELFDAVKLDVDNEKRPGKYVLTGSVRFSKRTLIRESLTGRSRTLQIYPFTCSEMLELPFEDRWKHVQTSPVIRVPRKFFQKILGNGGMPAIFSARNSAEVAAYWNSLIESYVYRDLLLSIPKNAKPVLALSILRAIAEILALGELPHFSRILRKVGGTRTQVERHLLGLEDLMILERVLPFKGSSALDIFLPFDSAFFLTLLNVTNPMQDAAIHLACIQIQMLKEFLAVRQYSDHQLSLRYTESPQGHSVLFVIGEFGLKQAGFLNFYQIQEEAVPHSYHTRYLNALIKKYGGTGCVLSSIESPVKMDELAILPWESVL